MLRTKLKAALLATTVAAAVIAPAAAASAASITVKDGKGDVWESTYDEDTQREVFTDRGSVLNVDLVSTTLTHGKAKLNVTMRYADLKKSGPVFDSGFDLRFDNGPARVAWVDTFTGWAGTHHLQQDSETGLITVDCSGFTHAIDYRANTVTLSIPRGCLGKPRWLQVSLLVHGQRTDATTTHRYLDNGATSGHAIYTWGKRLRRG